MTYGETAYRAYAEETGGKTYDGREMPAWADLGESVQQAWVAAAHAIRNRTLTEGR